MSEVADRGAIVWFDQRLGALNSNTDAHLGKSLHIPGIHLLSLVEMGG